MAMLSGRIIRMHSQSIMGYKDMEGKIAIVGRSGSHAKRVIGQLLESNAALPEILPDIIKNGGKEVEKAERDRRNEQTV